MRRKGQMTAATQLALVGFVVVLLGIALALLPYVSVATG
jgi:hypothetical protein